MAAGLLALLCLGLSLLITNVESQSSRCSVPSWNSRLGANPVTANRGKVLLVALLRGYCSYCVGQARRLQELKNSLAAEGLEDIAMLIVNGGESISRSNIQNLRSASSIPVIQDTPNHVMFRNVFRGNKDDFIVYNRCGQRIAYIPHPYSNLNNNVTERVLRVVHAGRHGCTCSLDLPQVNPHDVMYGDQPGQPTYTVTNNNSLDLNCPANDTWCRRYARNYRRNHLEIGSRQDRRINRPRFRPHQENNGGEQEQLGSGGHNHHNIQNNHRQHVSGGQGLGNGGTIWDCTNVSLTPTVLVPTHRCRCPRADIGEECLCTRPIYGIANDILSWHCGCHNPTFDTRSMCDHCHVCDNRPICREITQVATWQEYCRCQQAQGQDSSTQTSALTWQWQNSDGTTTDWQGTNRIWENSQSQNWQWQSSTGDIITSWQWNNGNIITTTGWQGQVLNNPWQNNSVTRNWQWCSSTDSFSTLWQWHNVDGTTAGWLTQGSAQAWQNCVTTSWQWQTTVSVGGWQWRTGIAGSWQWQWQ